MTKSRQKAIEHLTWCYEELKGWFDDQAPYGCHGYDDKLHEIAAFIKELKNEATV